MNTPDTDSDAKDKHAEKVIFAAVAVLVLLVAGSTAMYGAIGLAIPAMILAITGLVVMVMLTKS